MIDYLLKHKLTIKSKVNRRFYQDNSLNLISIFCVIKYNLVQ